MREKNLLHRVCKTARTPQNVTLNKLFVTYNEKKVCLDSHTITYPNTSRLLPEYPRFRGRKKPNHGKKNQMIRYGNYLLHLIKGGNTYFRNFASD